MNGATRPEWWISPPSSQGFVLVGLVLLLPVILGYTWWSYRVFAGKVAADSGYH